jgi:hypothetical protein
MFLRMRLCAKNAEVTKNAAAKVKEILPRWRAQRRHISFPLQKLVAPAAFLAQGDSLIGADKACFACLLWPIQAQIAQLASHLGQIPQL